MKTNSSETTTRSKAWKKLGLIITPQRNLWWMKTHAMVPTVDWLQGSLYRIYFSGRDDQNRSHIGYATIDVNSEKPGVLEYSSEPVLSLGNLGCFDDNGVTPSWVVNQGNVKYLYYIGWNRGSTVRMALLAGLAVSLDSGKTFQRYSNAPILERTNEEPYALNTAPCVCVEDGKWKMWYVACVEWIHKGLPRYNIRYAESDDGIFWKRNSIVCVNFKSDSENALARPCVLRENGKYKMWYSYKGDNYRIGYAESLDGISWMRMDDRAGINVSKVGWDSEMIEYAFIINHEGRKYMLYNGNDYGKEGIGLAEACP